MDKIFKIGLLVLGFGYLAYLYCPHTDQVGRYKYKTSGGSVSVFDTSNADLYLCTIASKKGAVTNIVTGELREFQIGPQRKETK